MSILTTYARRNPSYFILSIIPFSAGLFAVRAIYAQTSPENPCDAFEKVQTDFSVTGWSRSTLYSAPQTAVLNLKNAQNGNIFLDLPDFTSACSNSKVVGLSISACESDRTRSEMFSIALAALMGGKSVLPRYVCSPEGTAFLRELRISP